jgi:hypothetical protein
MHEIGIDLSHPGSVVISANRNASSPPTGHCQGMTAGHPGTASSDREPRTVPLLAATARRR